MPLVAVFPLRPHRDALLPAFLGRAAHAAFLRALAAVDAERATTLHDAPGPRPFTVSIVEEGIRQGRRETPARTASLLHLRVTLLDDTLESLLLTALAPGTRIDVGTLVCHVEDAAHVSTTAGVVARADYHELISQFLVPGASIAKRLRLRFHSPTTFHQQDRHLPLPLPQLVFASLAERWNAFAPVCLAPEVVRGFQHLLVGAYDLRTRLVDTGQGKLVGFLGWCEFRTEMAEPAVQAAATVLAAFATYAGVGHKTAMGLGHTEWIVSARSS